MRAKYTVRPHASFRKHERSRKDGVSVSPRPYTNIWDGRYREAVQLGRVDTTPSQASTTGNLLVDLLGCSHTNVKTMLRTPSPTSDRVTENQQYLSFHQKENVWKN